MILLHSIPSPVDTPTDENFSSKAYRDGLVAKMPSVAKIDRRRRCASAC